MTLTAPAWNKAEALRALEDDRILLLELVLLFQDEGPTLMRSVGQAVESRNARELFHAAHTLKGSVGNFAADGAREAASRLEMMGRSGDLRGVRDAWKILVEEMSQFDAELKEFVQNG